MKFVFTGLVVFGLMASANAQIEREEPAVGTGPQIQLNQQRIYGKVLNEATGKGLEAASVQLFIYAPGANGKDSLIRGTFTKGNGDFNFDNLPQADSFRVAISGIGFKEWSTIVRKSQAGATDLGDVVIAQESQVLNNVVISTQQRPPLQMGIDRKIFTVEQNITSSGGTALDVLRNVPSVSVDAEGAVQLRNAAPQIFVDGRPTILTPDQIPSDQVERIELITNPSSKFDASSSAGIINIVMKRNRRIGLNGIATVGAGHPSIINSNLSLNIRQGKVNFFVTGGYNQQGGIARGRTLRQNKAGGVIQNYFNQNSTNESMRRFGSVRFGLDFFASNRTTFSLTQNLVKGNFENEEQQNQEYLNNNKIMERWGYRQANAESRFNRYNTQLNFTRRFAEAGKELTANINYNYGNGNEAANIVNSFFLPNGLPYSDPATVRNQGRNNNDQYTFQVDYTDPMGENAKIEAGVRSFINKQRSLFSSFSVKNGTETLLPLSNNYAYTETVNAAYLSYANKINSFGYQLGLRAEVSRFDGELIDSAKSFGYSYPNSARRFIDALFPSVFLTQKVGDKTEFQLNYTRRIRRPNFWQLNPFIDINDPVNLRQGNPLLQPEFVNSFEFNYSQDYNKGNFLGVVYYRNNLRDITRYGDTISTALYQQLNNAAIDPNAILNTFINARSTNRLGLELTLQHKFTSNFDIIPTIDMQYRKVNAEAVGLSNSGFNWDAELTTNYRFTNTRGLLKDLGLQLVGEYESSEVTVQGKNLPQYQVDFGLRKEFLKDKKGTVSFNINDIFNTQRFGSIFDTDAFYQDSYRRRNVRSFRINFTYKFGKDDFKISRREERNNNDNDD
ncbi:MAG TPA: outer membrane beta-barrel family protein [Flavisolibacter sp.]|nr:outer membrane beta-barrel family protein [Flavisolibacter sp.]